MQSAMAQTWGKKIGKSLCSPAAAQLAAPDFVTTPTIGLCGTFCLATPLLSPRPCWRHLLPMLCLTPVALPPARGASYKAKRPQHGRGRVSAYPSLVSPPG